MESASMIYKMILFTRPASSAWLFAVSLFRQDMKERFAGSLLGSMWIFIWPMVQLFIYIVIFGKIMGGRFPGEAREYSYGIYVASGLIAWTCFAGTLGRASRVFVEKRHIIAKVRVTLWSFPLAACFVELLPCVVSLSVLSIVAASSGWRPSLPLVAYALLALYCQQILALGLGMLVAACAVFVRDAIEALAAAIQVGFWFTPIVYLPSILPDWAGSALEVNPMTHVAGAMQNLFVFGNAPSSMHGAYMVLVAHCVFILSFWFVRKLEKDIRDLL